MDLIRKIILGARQHYEKLILSVILLGLAGAVWYLNEASKLEEEKIQKFLQEITKRQNKPIKQLDVAEYEEALRRAQTPPVLNFALPHNLFNPVKWQRRPNGELLKVQTGDEVGWPQMAISKVTALKLTISMMKTSTSNYCTLGFTRESAPPPRNRLQQKYFTLNSTNKIDELTFVLKELKGFPDNPEATLELLNTGEKVTITANKPFEKVEAYEADLKYMVNGQTFNFLREGSTIRFLGEAYNIVSVGPNEVVASGSNNRKYPVRQKATP
jgi:hypothetical protein